MTGEPEIACGRDDLMNTMNQPIKCYSCGRSVTPQTDIVLCLFRAYSGFSTGV